MSRQRKHAKWFEKALDRAAEQRHNPAPNDADETSYCGPSSSSRPEFCLSEPHMCEYPKCDCYRPSEKHSDTPRTDNEAMPGRNWGDRVELVPAELAREMERELNALRSATGTCQAHWVQGTGAYLDVTRWCPLCRGNAPEGHCYRDLPAASTSSQRKEKG